MAHELGHLISHHFSPKMVTEINFQILLSWENWFPCEQRDAVWLYIIYDV